MVLGGKLPGRVDGRQNLYADVAQLAEQLTCNQQVIGSSPIIGFHFENEVFVGL